MDIMFRLDVGAAGLRRVLGFVAVAAAIGLSQPGAGIAQTCGSDYTIKEGETLAQIAARAYGNPSQWTIIFYANQDRLGANASLLVPGLALRLPCVGGTSQPALPPLATTPAQPPATSETVLSSKDAYVRRSTS